MNQKWEEFLATGSVKDYLIYKGYEDIEKKSISKIQDEEHAGDSRSNRDGSKPDSCC